MTNPPDEAASNSWTRAVDRIIRGEKVGRFVRLGQTTQLLQDYGLGSGELAISAGKIARARRDHPEVPLDVWYMLPSLLQVPLAIFPSYKRDGSIVVATVAFDRDGNPIIAPIIWDETVKRNVVLSLYGRSGTESLDARQWMNAQIQWAQNENLPVYENFGPADSEPKPNTAFDEGTSWSPGIIPADRPARPRKEILTLRSKVNRPTSDIP